jgi:flagellar protein FlbD
MIQLTRINQSPLILNSDLIEHIEAAPDTIICLTTGQKMIVRESPAEVIDKVVACRGEFVSMLRGGGVGQSTSIEMVGRSWSKRECSG